MTVVEKAVIRRSQPRPLHVPASVPLAIRQLSIRMKATMRTSRRSAKTAAAAALLLVASSGTSSVMASNAAEEHHRAAAAQHPLSDSFDEGPPYQGRGVDQPPSGKLDEQNDIHVEVSDNSADYGGAYDGTIEEDEEEGIIIVEAATKPLVVNRDPLAEELRTVREMRRQLQEVSEQNGGFVTTRNKKYGGKFLTKLRERNGSSDSTDDTDTADRPDESAANARKNGRFDGLKALQSKLRSDIDTEISELDITKADLEAEYSALADEIAELEIAEANEEKREALLEEKRVAMHIITEKMVEHEAAKVDCDHAMRAASKKKKVLDEIAGECDELRTKLDHTKSELNSVEQELEHLKNDPDDGSDRRLGHHLTKEETEAKIAALKAKQKLLRDEEAKLDADEVGLLEEKANVHQSVIDRAKYLITELMTQDEAVKHALQTCLRTKMNAEKDLELAQEEKDAVCANVKTTAQAMRDAENDVKKVDDFLKSTEGRKLRGSGGNGKGTEL